jgi:hypothetical protein
MIRAVTIFIAVVLMWSSPARAVEVIRTYTFTASDFTPYIINRFPCGFPFPACVPPVIRDAPVSTVNGVFTVQFDNSIISPFSAGSFSIETFNLPASFPQFAYDASLLGGTIWFGNFEPRFGYSGDDDFFLQVTGTGEVSFSYSSAITQGQHIATSVTASYTEKLVSSGPGPSPVPEPSTWAMLILGFFAIGAATRNRALVSYKLQGLR